MPDTPTPPSAAPSRNDVAQRALADAVWNRDAALPCLYRAIYETVVGGTHPSQVAATTGYHREHIRRVVIMGDTDQLPAIPARPEGDSARPPSASQALARELEN